MLVSNWNFDMVIGIVTTCQLHRVTSGQRTVVIISWLIDWYLNCLFSLLCGCYKYGPAQIFRTFFEGQNNCKNTTGD